jgi:hypothetical protein
MFRWHHIAIRQVGAVCIKSKSSAVRLGKNDIAGRLLSRKSTSAGRVLCKIIVSENNQQYNEEGNCKRKSDS